MRNKVQLWITLGDQWLMLKTIPSRGGFWQPITGGVEPGELVIQAARREAFEETGLELDRETFVFSGEAFEFQSRWGHQAREFVFWTRIPVTAPSLHIQCEPREHDAFAWCSKELVLECLDHPTQRDTKKVFAKILDLSASMAT